MEELTKFLRWVSSGDAPSLVFGIAAVTVAVTVAAALLTVFLLFVGLVATGHYALAVLLFPVSPVAVCYVAYRRATK